MLALVPLGPTTITLVCQVAMPLPANEAATADGWVIPYPRAAVANSRAIVCPVIGTESPEFIPRYPERRRVENLTGKVV